MSRLLTATSPVLDTPTKVTPTQLMYVEWEDASDVDDSLGWVTRADAKPAKAVIIRQVGFVTEVDGEALVMTQAFSDELMASRTRIPLGMVRKALDLSEHVSD